MKRYLRLVLFGALIWMFALAVAMVLTPIRASQRPLFESIMAVVVAAGTAFFGDWYLRDVKGGFVREALLAGVIWLAVNIALDLPLFLLQGPMQMSLAEYLTDIGLTYLIIPIVMLAIGYSVAQHGALQQQQMAGQE
jgi:hypothetical protein